MEKEIQEAIEELKVMEDVDLCVELIRTKGIKSPAFAEAALETGIFYPNILYRDASEEVRDRLIHMLEQEENDLKENDLEVNGILMALAAIGDDTVYEYFKKWEENPPAWRKKLYVGPAGYALEGGWCMEDGRKRELTFEECYALEQREDCGEEEYVSGGAAEDKCPYCGSSYENLLVIDGRDKRLAFLGIHGKIKIKCCCSCLPWEDFIYCKYEEDGESTVINRVGGAGGLVDDDSLNRRKPFVISRGRVSKAYCTEFDRCAIGGTPAFVDDAKYAVCPECGKRMKHLAQLGEEWTRCGTEYVQICTDCRIAATMYQQT